MGCLDFLGRHVTQGRLILGDFQLDVKGGFQIGLVEAWEGPTSVTGLELGTEHVVEIVILWYGRCSRRSRLIFGAVETGHGIVDGATEVDHQRRLGVG